MNQFDASSKDYFFNVCKTKQPFLKRLWLKSIQMKFQNRKMDKVIATKKDIMNMIFHLNFQIWLPHDKKP